MTGANVSPMLTWDTKITALLSLMGGTTETITHYLRQKNLLTKFVNRIETEYSIVFRNVVGSDVPFAGPRKLVTEGRPDFLTCRKDSQGGLLRQE